MEKKLYRVSLIDGYVPDKAGESFELKFEGRKAKVRLEDDPQEANGVYSLDFRIDLVEGVGTAWKGTRIAALVSQTGEGSGCTFVPQATQPEGILSELAEVHAYLMGQRAVPLDVLRP